MTSYVCAYRGRIAYNGSPTIQCKGICSGALKMEVIAEGTSQTKNPPTRRLRQGTIEGYNVYNGSPMPTWTAIGRSLKSNN